MSQSETAVATLYLNKPVEGGDDHWTVLLDENEDQHSDSGSKSKIFLHEGAILRIGRSSSNDIVVRSKLASRFHALLSVTRNAVVVCDLESLNGSFVNGYRIDAPQDISNGDIMRIGPVEFSASMRASRTVEGQGASEGNTSLYPVEVVLLLADIKNYKQRLTHASGDEITPVLRNWFSDARECITTNDGVIDRFLGDGVLAFWIGDESKRTTNVNKALRAAGQLQARTTALPTVTGQDSPWQCSISLSSGSAMMSHGQGPHTSALVLGSVMNEVFAINTMAKRSDVGLSCSSETAEALQTVAEMKELPELHSPAVLNKVLKPYEILGAKRSA